MRVPVRGRLVEGLVYQPINPAVQIASRFLEQLGLGPFQAHRDRLSHTRDVLPRRLGGQTISDDTTARWRSGQQELAAFGLGRIAPGSKEDPGRAVQQPNQYQ